MEKTIIQIPTLDAMPAAAQQFVEAMQGRRIFAFYGHMGAGKTTFIKALCAALGSTDDVNSPTFAIVNEYDSHEGPIYHFDFYRIKNQEEVIDLGFDDYLYSGNVCLMEWPELVEELLPEDTVRVEICENADGTRTLTL